MRDTQTSTMLKRWRDKEKDRQKDKEIYSRRENERRDRTVTKIDLEI